MFYGYTESFSASYRAARDKFRAAARDANAQLASYPYPGASGIDGEALTVDVAQLGDAASPRQFVMISATHGMEGYAGAALQTSWLRAGIDAGLLRRIGVVLVHGLNPYGFSHGIRTTEGGVDLNRNFIDFSSRMPDNPGYGELHALLSADAADADAWAQAQAALQAARERIGDNALFDTVARGQYTHPDGVFYGGAARTWENRTLEAIIARFAGKARKVAAIDWHTGIGDYGQPFFLAFADAHSDAYQHTMRWWRGDHALAARQQDRGRPRYRGLVFDGLRDFLPNAEVAGGVVEWGTRGAEAGDLAIRQDLWLRRFGPRLTDDARAQIRADLLDSLNPVSYQWRTSVLSLGMEITDATACGLADW